MHGGGAGVGHLLYFGKVSLFSVEARLSHYLHGSWFLVGVHMAGSLHILLYGAGLVSALN